MTLALNGCNREAMNWVATTAGRSGNVVHHGALTAVANRVGDASHAPSGIEWLNKNPSGRTADDTRRFAATRVRLHLMKCVYILSFARADQDDPNVTERDGVWARIEFVLPGKEGRPGRTAADNRRFVEAV